MGMFLSEGSSAEGDVQQPMPFAGTLGNFTVRIISDGITFTAIVRKNGVDTALACTIPAPVAVTCSDTTDTVSFAAGDLISVRTTTDFGARPAVWTARYQ
jgi:hypothetical protein